MAKTAKVYFRSDVAGYLEQYDEGYRFTYDQKYLAGDDPKPISLTLPLVKYPYTSRVLFAFFDGLIPEGWLLNIAEKHWKIKGNDRFELLITLCKDAIGAVSIIPVEGEDNE